MPKTVVLKKRKKKIKCVSGTLEFPGRKKESMALWKPKYKGTKTKCEKSENKDFKRLVKMINIVNPLFKVLSLCYI